MLDSVFFPYLQLQYVFPLYCMPIIRQNNLIVGKGHRKLFHMASHISKTRMKPEMAQQTEMRASKKIKKKTEEKMNE